MRSRYLFGLLGLLAFSPDQARASCTDIDNVTITAVPDSGSGSGRVEYNPFNPQAAMFSIQAQFDESCVEAQTVTLRFPATGGTITNFPELRVRNGGTTIYQSNTDYNGAGGQSTPVNFVSAGSNRGSVTLTAEAIAQMATETAFSPTGPQNVAVDIEFGLDGDTTVTRNVNIPVETLLQRIVALTDDFLAGETEQDVDFGTIDENANVKSNKLWLWSNADFRITAQSENDGKLLRTDAGEDPSSFSQIPYTLTISNGSNILTYDQNTGVGVAATSANIGPTIVDGTSYDVDITIAAGDGADKRAGTYEDTITLTIQSPL